VVQCNRVFRLIIVKGLVETALKWNIMKGIQCYLKRVWNGSNLVPCCCEPGGLPSLNVKVGQFFPYSKSDNS
jgi:hypothetical protein